MAGQTLADYVEAWKTPRGREEITLLGVPYLVETGAYRAPIPGLQPSRSDFRTGEVDLDAIKARQLPHTQRHVFPIQKRAASPFSGVVSVGRTLNLDIALPRPGISKLHAQFSEASQGRYGITDRDSRNGTFVAGERIAAHTWTEVKDGDEVRFATFCFRFLTVPALTQLLSGLVNERE